MWRENSTHSLRCIYSGGAKIVIVDLSKEEFVTSVSISKSLNYESRAYIVNVFVDTEIFTLKEGKDFSIETKEFHFKKEESGVRDINLTGKTASVAEPQKIMLRIDYKRAVAP